MKSLLPNQRWLCLPSENLGKDWSTQVQLIDDALESLSFDLAQETIFILYDRAPGAVLNNEAHCYIARSVLGAKKSPSAPFKLIDWVQAPVWRSKLTGPVWPSLLEDSYQEWERLQREGHKLAADFMIVATRKLDPELVLETEVIFHE